jgi:alpha-glucuronidase
MNKILITLLCLIIINSSNVEDGNRLWLRFHKISDKQLLLQYQQQVKSIHFNDEISTLNVAKNELIEDLNGLLGK